MKSLTILGLVLFGFFVGTAATELVPSARLVERMSRLWQQLEMAIRSDAACDRDMLRRTPCFIRQDEP